MSSDLHVSMNIMIVNTMPLFCRLQLSHRLTILNRRIYLQNSSHHASFGIRRGATQFLLAAGTPRSSISPQLAIFSQLNDDLAFNPERLCITVSNIDLTSSVLQQDAELL